MYENMTLHVYVNVGITESLFPKSVGSIPI